MTATPTNSPANSPTGTGAGDSGGTPRRELEFLRRMLLIRRFEERCAQLYQQSHIHGFLHLYIGEEAVAVGLMDALDPGDAVVATYREHGHALMKGVPTGAVMAEMLGRVDGCSGGRGGSMHLFEPANRFYGGNAIVGGGLPLAVGLALADRFLGRDHVTACFFGEGAAAEGEFHESMNLAALWNLPVLFCCENNLYAMGTALARTHARTNLAERAATYGMPAEAVDGMAVEAVAEAARRAVDAARAGGGPQFLELRTYRFRAHSMYDPERYRDKQEVVEWRERDPIDHLVDQLRSRHQLGEDELDAIESSVRVEIDEAVEFAMGSPLEPVEDLLRHVYADEVSS